MLKITSPVFHSIPHLPGEGLYYRCNSPTPSPSPLSSSPNHSCLPPSSRCCNAYLDPNCRSLAPFAGGQHHIASSGCDGLDPNTCQREGQNISAQLKANPDEVLLLYEVDIANQRGDLTDSRHHEVRFFEWRLKSFIWLFGRKYSASVRSRRESSFQFVTSVFSCIIWRKNEKRQRDLRCEPSSSPNINHRDEVKRHTCELTTR